MSAAYPPPDATAAEISKWREAQGKRHPPTCRCGHVASSHDGVGMGCRRSGCRCTRYERTCVTRAEVTTALAGKP
jgi:hypothetical protein